MRERIQQIIENVNPRGFTNALKADPETLEYLKQLFPGVSNCSELLWLYKNQKSNVCENGQKRKFKNFAEGYRIGCSRHCVCVVQSQSDKLAEWHKNLDAEHKQQLIDKARQTFQQNYGVSNPMQVPEIKAKTKNAEGLWPIQTTKVQNKIRQTNQERYGGPTPFHSAQVVEKALATQVEKYGALMTQARKAYREQNNNKNPFAVNKNKVQETLDSKYGKDRNQK